MKSTVWFEARSAHTITLVDAWISELNDALGHAAFDYIESRWGRAGIRRFVNALIVPRVDKTYDAVFELTPAAFDTAFRQYAERRFAPIVR